MVRTQIQLTERQARKVRMTAKQEGISVAKLIRQCVEEGLIRRGTSRAALYERANRLVGSGAADTAVDLSTNHDRYLDETFG